jgi:hypothetical protein
MRFSDSFEKFSSTFPGFDASEAVREAARHWPLRAREYRLIDRLGREIFGRDRD